MPTERWLGPSLQVGVLHHPDLYVAIELETPRGLGEIAAHVAQQVDSQRYRTNASIPTASVHVGDLGVVNVNARQILGDGGAYQEIRFVNRVHLDSNTRDVWAELTLNCQIHSTMECNF